MHLRWVFLVCFFFRFFFTERLMVFRCSFRTTISIFWKLIFARKWEGFVVLKVPWEMEEVEEVEESPIRNRSNAERVSWTRHLISLSCACFVFGLGLLGCLYACMCSRPDYFFVWVKSYLIFELIILMVIVKVVRRVSNILSKPEHIWDIGIVYILVQPVLAKPHELDWYCWVKFVENDSIGELLPSIFWAGLYIWT